MARRMKEEPIVHQNRIAEKAMLLFASEKEEYLRIGGNLTKEKFLMEGFEKIYKLIKA